MHRQHGAALMVSLVFLLVLTVIGLAAVRMTTQQSRMASNFQQRTATFQAAEGAINTVMSELRGETAAPNGARNLLVDAIDETDAAPQRSYDAGSGLSTIATLEYAGQSPVPGYSLGTGSEAIVGHRFKLDAQSELANSYAVAEHEQGLQRVGPGF